MEDGVKRKRAEDADGQERAAKRIAHGSKAYQREIAALYAAYDALHKAVGSKQGREDDFLTLLHAAQGSAAAQRLAARLLPKFARHFPAHVSGAATALMGLATLSLNDETSASTRRDALGGLTPLVDAALSSNNVDVVMDIVRFALRQLQVQRGAAFGEGWVEVGPADHADGSDGAVKCSTPDAAPAEALWCFLKAAFGALPRAVLAACFHLLRDPGNALHTIAMELLEDHILSPSVAAEGPEEEAAWGKEPLALPPPTLAAAVLRSCAAKDAKWAAKTVQQFLMETPPEVSDAVRPVLERLLQQLPPGTVSPGPPPHGGGTNGRSSRPPSHSVSPGPGSAPACGQRPLRGDSQEPGQRSRTPDQRFRGSPAGRGAQQWSAPERAGMAAGGRGGSDAFPRPPRHQDLVLDEGELPPEEAAAFFLPSPGGPVCLAAACLYLSGLPRSATHQAIYAACGRNSPQCVVFPPQGPCDAAFVTFRSLRGATRCYEEMADNAVFPGGGRGAVGVQFCSREAHPLDLPPPPDKPATHVWVGGACSKGDEEDIRRRLSERGVPEPEHALQVQGRRPGVLLSFASHLAAESAVLVMQHAGPYQQQQLRGRSASIAPTRGRGSPGPPLLRDQRRHSPSEFRQQQQSGRGGREFLSQQRYPPPHASRPLPPPEYRSCCLWVGQVPGAHGESEMMAAFRQFGIISSHKFMRKTAKPYAFVDFTTLEAATEARIHLDGAPVGGSRLVVEFKEEKHYNKSGPKPGGPRGGDLYDGGGGGGYRGPPVGCRGPPLPPQQQGYRGSPGLGAGREPNFGGRGGGGSGRDFRDDRGGVLGWERGRERRDKEPAHLRSRTPSPSRRRWEQGQPQAEAPVAALGPGWDRPPPHRPAAAAGTRPPDHLQRLYSAVSVELPPLPAAAPQAPQAAPLPAAAAAASLGWHGSLAKSHQPQCKVVCTDPGGAWGGDVPGSWAAREPAAWPETLDVQKRTDVAYVCGTLFPSLPASDRTLRLVVAPPEDPGERPKLAGFASYLRSKRRAGVVALPEARGAPMRSLYLIPPTEESCRQLGLSWPPAQVECMVVLVARAAEATS